ncbi:unnamed protein product [Amoebophrya sp. A120]|nr:unnamed protein product [Amoebophrya sp. A120]|eukprot:GSA120T00013626001.1
MKVLFTLGANTAALVLLASLSLFSENIFAVNAVKVDGRRGQESNHLAATGLAMHPRPFEFAGGPADASRVHAECVEGCLAFLQHSKKKAARGTASAKAEAGKERLSRPQLQLEAQQGLTSHN